MKLVQVDSTSLMTLGERKPVQFIICACAARLSSWRLQSQMQCKTIHSACRLDSLLPFGYSEKHLCQLYGDRWLLCNKRQIKTS